MPLHPSLSRRAAAVIATGAVTLACSGTASTSAAPNAVVTAFVPPAVTDPRLPRTRAERSNYAETSHYADVVAFIDSLRRIGAPIAVGTIGTTNETRSLPYVI
ncbi:MAG: hypothetical protein K0S86_5044, partial [Geminicoccaceae bacterium]|nr:hypothetical protein [Geminicoccaceae bacterium]